MTAGEPPLPPSRTSYPPWQGRPYRRRGGPPATLRTAWVARRPRSPPPASRPRHVRGAGPHRHHRHLSHPHPNTYHPHAPPPLSRNLQGRLRSPPRSPPPRRPDPPLHRDDSARTDSHQGDRERVDQRRSDHSHSRPDPIRQDSRRSDPLRSDPPLRTDSSRLDSHRHEHRADHRLSDLPRSDSHQSDHPYRGEPGPSHRVEPTDRNPSFRTDSYPSRPPPPKPRSDPAAPRSDHRPHRSTDHHVPYRGEPGPLYRADLSPYRDEVDSRRQPVESGSGRGDGVYGPWFRHTSRIHKPLKRKIRRHAPLGSAPGRPMLAKPESPILSRMSFSHPERGSAALRTDNTIPSAGSNVNPSLSFSSTKWQAEASPRLSAKSPRSSESATRSERMQRLPASADVTPFPSRKRPPPLSGHVDQSKSPVADSFSNKSSISGGRGLNEEKATSEERTPSTLFSGSKGDAQNGREKEIELSVRDLPIPIERIRRFGTNVAPELKSVSTDRSGHHDTTKYASNSVANGHASGTSEKQKAHSTTRTEALSTKTEVPSYKSLQVTTRDRPLPKMSLGDRNPAAALRGETASNFGRTFGERKPIVRSEATVKGFVGVKSHTLTRESLTKVSSQSKRSTQPSLGKVVAGDNTGASPSRNGKNMHQNLPTPKSEPGVWEESLKSLSKLLNPPAPSPNGVPSREPETFSGPAPSIVAKSKSDGTHTISMESTKAKSQIAAPVSKESDRALRMISTGSTFSPSKLKQCESPKVKINTKVENTEVKMGSPSKSLDRGLTESKIKSRKAPSLPSLNLRSILSFGTASSPTPSGKLSTSVDPLPDLHSLLRPDVQKKDTKRPHPPIENPLSHQGPISIPASAISLLRSSPRSRTHDSSVDTPSKRLTSLCLVDPTIWKSQESSKSSVKITSERDILVQQIHRIDKRISEVERKLASLRQSKLCTSLKTEQPAQNIVPTNVSIEEGRRMHRIAAGVAARVDPHSNSLRHVSPDPLHAALRLILGHNNAKAFASAAALRPICSEPDRGLRSARQDFQSFLSKVEPGTLAAVTVEMRKRECEASEKKRALHEEYADLRDSWVHKLKSARDKKSKEKREATKERDRFLVLRTKGHSALLTSRTSSGRTSTKLFPSLNANGHPNSNTEVDALLADIAAAGGTPGSKEIWSKTLAEVPDQDGSHVPCDSGSVFVEDPIADFAASRYVNPWYFHEKLIFLEKFIVYSKNFRKIASFLKHKSTRECSQFYYSNKLDLGLKQLAKESSGMKRKGILRSHIVSLAKKRLCFESEEVIAAAERAFLAAKNLVISSSCDRGQSSELLIDHSPSSAHYEKHQIQSMKMMLKKRIMVEQGALDISDIDFMKFSKAIALYGIDWRKISSFMEVEGKSSSHYREFYKKNRRKLRHESDKRSYPRLTAMPRCRTPPLRQSPRASPQASPRSSPSASHRRLGRNLSSREFDTLTHNHVSKLSGQEVSKGTTKHSKGSSPAAISTHRLKNLVVEDKMLTEFIKPKDDETESRKSRTSTWTAEEGEQFRDLFKRYGRDWKRIAQIMTPKTPTQVKGYWKKVAHEVGNGLSADSTKPKNERKRSRRSAAVDELNGDEMNDSRRSSSERRSPSSRQGNAAYNDNDRRQAKRQRHHASSEDHDPRLPETGLGSNKKRHDGSCHSAGSSGDLVEQQRGLHLNGPVDETINACQRKETTPVGDGASSKRGDGAASSLTKVPLLRSTPVLAFRSVPAGEGTRLKKDHIDDICSSPKVDGKGRVGDVPRHAELRKTAESYGVLAHLGNRLEGASNAQVGKRQS